MWDELHVLACWRAQGLLYIRKLLFRGLVSLASCQWYHWSLPGSCQSQAVALVVFLLRVQQVCSIAKITCQDMPHAVNPSHPCMVDGVGAVCLINRVLRAVPFEHGGLVPAGADDVDVCSPARRICDLFGR